MKRVLPTQGIVKRSNKCRYSEYIEMERIVR